ncbi:uncharacterized protein L203_100537 [Cryptococcus depauperatus CBS 7841]|uniref:Uncharacterized protein n=1 Tax=Cryptococcus depauperatus CBS 7841 TaxID=1295531 RepID=A0A1E3HRY7_9TREE|nr:hypothetical protein L203_06074 [Cryptococcus depauperatus CBS 7841]
MRKNYELVKQHYELGLKCMSNDDYEEAWKNFDKAINFGGINPVLLDCKAAAMNKSPAWRDKALQITKDMITKWPKDFKGYYRQASVLYSMKAYDYALKAIARAVELGPKQSQNEKQFRSIQELRAAITMQKIKTDQNRAENDSKEANRQQEARILLRKAKINYTHLLSRDVLLVIAQQGLAENPGFIFRMAGVCKAWREILLNQPGLWSAVVLNGRKRIIQKLEAVIKRSRGRILDLKIVGLDDHHFVTQLGLLLQPYVPHLRHLDIVLSHDVSLSMLEHWYGLLSNIESLRVVNTKTDVPLPKVNVISRLFCQSHASLRHLDISHSRLYLPARNPASFLASVQTIRVRSCIITIKEETTCDEIKTFVSHLPQARIIEIDDVTFDSLSGPCHATIDELPFLHTYYVQHDSANIFDSIAVPSLKDLEVPSLRIPSMTTFLSAPGFIASLSQLRALNLSDTPLTDGEVIVALRSIPALQFLNVTACTLTNTFLEALIKRNHEKDTLVPSLVALSIARNAEITGGPLTKFIVSRACQDVSQVRLPLSLSDESESQPLHQHKKSSTTFKSNKIAFGRPTKPSSRTNSITNQSSSSLNPHHPSAQQTSSSPLSNIKWLNIDYCEGIDPSAVGYLRNYVNCLFYSFHGPLVKDRINGKGRWSWKADLGSATGEA